MTLLCIITEEGFLEEEVFHRLILNYEDLKEYDLAAFSYCK